MTEDEEEGVGDTPRHMVEAGRAECGDGMEGNTCSATMRVGDGAKGTRSRMLPSSMVGLVGASCVGEGEEEGYSWSTTMEMGDWIRDTESRPNTMDGKHVCFAAHGHDTSQHRRLVRLECHIDFPLVDIHWLVGAKDTLGIQWYGVHDHWGWPVTAPREMLRARQRGAMAPIMGAGLHLLF